MLASDDDNHQTLVACALNNMPNDMDKKGWWSQAVAVAYEQHIGRRQPGQRLDGQFEVAISKTINIPRATLADAWCEFFELMTEVNGHPSSNVRTSRTDVRDYIRADIGDGKFESAVESKTEQKSLLVVTMSNLASDQVRSEWRDYWKTKLDQFVDSL